jgi:hypothetical protein
MGRKEPPGHDSTIDCEHFHLTFNATIPNANDGPKITHKYEPKDEFSA